METNLWSHCIMVPLLEFLFKLILLFKLEIKSLQFFFTKNCFAKAFCEEFYITQNDSPEFKDVPQNCTSSGSIKSVLFLNGDCLFFTWNVFQLMFLLIKMGDSVNIVIFLFKWMSKWKWKCSTGTNAIVY